MSFGGKRICRTCHRKHIILIPHNPQIFREPVDKHHVMFVNLTRTQEIILKKRIKYLFPHMKQSIGTYVRGLILGDLQFWLKGASEISKEESQ